MPTMLDSAPARPLTNREISKLLCAMLNGVAAVEPDASLEFSDVLTLSQAVLTHGAVSKEGLQALTELHTAEKRATWRIAVAATIGGLDGWCDRAAIETAIMWVSENLPRMFPRPMVH